MRQLLAVVVVFSFVVFPTHSAHAESFAVKELVSRLSSQSREMVIPALDEAFKLLEKSDEPVVWAAISAKIEEEDYQKDVMDRLQVFITKQPKLPTTIVDRLKSFIKTQYNRYATPAVDVLTLAAQDEYFEFLSSLFMEKEVEDLVKTKIVKSYGETQKGKGINVTPYVIQGLVAYAFITKSIPNIFAIIDSLVSINHPCALTALTYLKLNPDARVQEKAVAAIATLISANRVGPEFEAQYGFLPDCIDPSALTPDVMDRLKTELSKEQYAALEKYLKEVKAGTRGWDKKAKKGKDGKYGKGRRLDWPTWRGFYFFEQFRIKGFAEYQALIDRSMM